MSTTPVSIVSGLTAQDDYTHPVPDEPNFNETFLFHFSGRSLDGTLYGGLIRVANRPNEEYAECTVIVWLPDGSCLFSFERPRICGNEGWSVSNWTMEVVQAGGIEFLNRYDGPVLHLRDPMALLDPKRAWKESPKVHLQLSVKHFGKGPMARFATRRTGAKEHDPQPQKANGMLQFTECSGDLTIGDESTVQFQGYGWRDHNWGVRNWQGFTDHIMLTANFDRDAGICLYSTTDGCGYAYHRGTSQSLEVVSAQIEVDYHEVSGVPQTLTAAYELEDGTKGHFKGSQKGYVPLRNIKDGKLTRIGYSLWEYENLENGQKFHGLGEFLTQRMLESP